MAAIASAQLIAQLERTVRANPARSTPVLRRDPAMTEAG
jgi:hypothetical protein